MKVTGEMIIFRNEKGYSTSISNKKEDGTYENMIVAVNFKKGVELENKTRIMVTDGFLSFYKTKDGLPKIKIVVMGYTFLQEQQTTEITEDDELPF